MKWLINQRKFIFHVFVILAVAGIFNGCGSSTEGQLVGVPGRVAWYQPTPYGMVYIPMGSFVMGLNDNDVPFAHVTKAKTVSLQAFYMDDAEISNNEYRQFVVWVQDSILRTLLGEDDQSYLITKNEYGEDIDPPILNWKKKLEYDDPKVREKLKENLFIPESERFYRREQIDARKLTYVYWWIDFKDAAQKGGPGAPLRQRGLKDRSIFIKKDVINIYPDTLTWVHDFTYSFNEPLTNNYFWHPAYDDYPVVGVTWKQARAFSIWRTQLYNSYLESIGGVYVNDFRLPTEAEWEWAARGSLMLSQYPWGGPYTRNSEGCFLANFKPLRGNYVDDGGLHTVKVYSYNPNEYGLYCMAGNVAEWVSTAYDESVYDFAHDLNPEYVYEAKDDDPPAKKRKVIRGGSWKDIAFFLQCGARTFEYQDTAKCYIGFRNVMTFLGRSQADQI